MIDFACKRFDLTEVVKCALALTKADCAVMTHFRKHDGWKQTDEVASALRLNLSTVQRAVKKLHEKRVLKRRQENLTGGGYLFTYHLNDRAVIKETIMDLVAGWTTRVEKELELF